jgi:hypothetical protein
MMTMYASPRNIPRAILVLAYEAGDFIISYERTYIHTHTHTYTQMCTRIITFNLVHFLSHCIRSGAESVNVCYGRIQSCRISTRG